MNILFLTSAAPRRAAFSTDEKRPPLGVGILISILKKAGHKVFFYDEYLLPSSVLNTDFIIKRKIDFVCIYSNTICYQSTLEMFGKINRKRELGLWNGKIVVGGPHTSFGSKEIPDYVDHIVVGEGEKTILKILAGEINDRVIVGEKFNQEEMDDLPRPAWEEFVWRNYDWSFPFGLCKEKSPCYTINTSRGCPFDCTFCSVKGIWGKNYRYMSADRIINDIKYMIDVYGAKSFYFREDHFTLNKKRVEKFCNLLIKHNIDIVWACETRVDQLCDFEYQKLMCTAGCKLFYIGVESGSPRMLELFKKDETVEQFIKAFDIAHKVGIKTYASFVVEAPTETEYDRKLTDKLIEKIEPDFVGKNVYVGLPGSKLYDYMRKNNLYEFEDEFGVLYPNGYQKNIKKYYGNEKYFSVYNSKKELNKCTDSVFMQFFDKLYKSPPKAIIDSIKYKTNKLFKYKIR